jgi:hypothetical protein
MLYPTERSIEEIIISAATWLVFAATGVLALAVLF